jgi:mannose-1-phosphate guanylyltransferase
MFQRALERLSPIFSPAQILVVTRADYVNLLHSQTPDVPLENFIIEPEGRGTAPAIGLAAIHIRRRDPEGVMAVLTADHFIADPEGFRRALAAAETAARAGHLVTLGIKPSSPSTGYGYIKRAERLAIETPLPVFRIEQFVEKPDLTEAARMAANTDYSWNSGMFIWRVDRILYELQRQMPAFYAQLAEVECSLEMPAYAPTLNRIWPQVAEQTIDYGVMEHAQDAVVVPINIGWTDVGSWSSLTELLPRDENGNNFMGDHVAIDTHNCLVIGEERFIATIGVKELVIVDTADALLICSKEREQDVRAVVRQLTKEGRTVWV